MALIDIKFTKFDNTPWGFRLVGGSDFPQPLMVTRVSEGSLAECMGLQACDEIVRLNDQPISDLTHAEAHEAMLLAGNNFTLRVKRDGVPVPGQEEIDEENTASYMLPVEDILLGKGNPLEEKERFQISPIEFKPIEFPPMDFTPMEFPSCDFPPCDFPSTDYQSLGSEDLQQDYEEVLEEVEITEEIPEKPRDENSEIVANKNLTDEEIAQLILEEEELLSDKGVLGVNFKKLRPRIPLLKESKVLQELQNEVIAEPPQVAEVKRVLRSTFLQKPERPVPMPRSKEPETAEPEAEPYKVVIKKQPRKGVTERLIAQGLLEPGSIRTPETRSEKNTPSATPEPHVAATPEPAESRPESKAEVVELEEVCEREHETSDQLDNGEQSEVRVEEPEDEDEDRCSIRSEEQTVMSQRTEPLIKFDKKKIKALVTEELSLEKQLESVQSQLLALKQLPSEIEKHLRLVSEQLQKIAELSGARINGQDLDSNEEEEEENREKEEREREKQSQEEEEQRQEEQSDIEDGRRSAMSSGEPPQIVEPSDDESNKDFEISVKSDDEDHRVKKCVVSYETKILKEKADIQRDLSSSPAPSLGSYEPDPNLPPQEQLIQELQHRQGRKRSQELWPQAKQLELTYGRRWRCPNDFFNDEMIAEVLSGQAEVIRGRAMGVNFKKYEKTALPNYDHLMNSSVYKMIHKMEREPKKGIPARPPKVNAAEDIIERVNTPCMSMADDNSLRSVSH